MPSLSACLKAIQNKCLDCCGGNKTEVELCQIPDCPLYNFRLGDRQGNLLKPVPEQKSNIEIEKKQASFELPGLPVRGKANK